HILIKPEATPESLRERLDRIERFVESANDRGFHTAAEEGGFTVDTSLPVVYGQRIASLGGTPEMEVSEWAFNAKPKNTSNVFRTRNHYAVAYLAERLPEGLAEYEQVSDKVGRDIRNAAAEAMARKDIDSVWALVQEGAELEKAANRVAVEYKQIGPFTRQQNVSALDSDPSAIGAAFALTNVGDMSEPIEYSNGFVIMELIERSEPELLEFENKRDSVVQAIAGQKRQQAYVAWYESKLEDAEIQNNLNWQTEVQ
ncbi:hypothetical protein GF377_05745, partial [candidate division GN15 bacterium]|nr:hypothetical protein [candidate division GN15 bacterium]